MNEVEFFLAHFFYTWQESTAVCKFSRNTKFQTTSVVLFIKAQQISNFEGVSRKKAKVIRVFLKNVKKIKIKKCHYF